MLSQVASFREAFAPNLTGEWLLPRWARASAQSTCRSPGTPAVLPGARACACARSSGRFARKLSREHYRPFETASPPYACARVSIRCPSPRIVSRKLDRQTTSSPCACAMCMCLVKLPLSGGESFPANLTSNLNGLSQLRRRVSGLSLRPWKQPESICATKAAWCATPLTRRHTPCHTVER